MSASNTALGDDAQIARAKVLAFEGALLATCGAPVRLKDGYARRKMGSPSAMDVV